MKWFTVFSALCADLLCGWYRPTLANTGLAKSKRYTTKPWSFGMICLVIAMGGITTNQFAIGQGVDPSTDTNPAAVQQEEQPIYSDPQKRGYIPNVSILKEPKVLWTFESKKRPNGRDNGLSSPSVLDGVVYVGDDLGVLRAFDSASGEQQWEYDHGTRIYSTPVCDGRNVYITSTNGIDAVSCESGELSWKKRHDGIEGYSDCVVWPGRVPGEGKITTVFYSTDDGELHAVDTRSGRAKWHRTLMENVPDEPAGFDGNRARMSGRACRPTGISTNGDVVIQSIFDQCRIVAVGNRSGAEQWSFETQGWTLRPAAIDGDDVLIGSQSRKIFCVSLDTGKLKWEFQSGSRIESTPGLDESHVYVPSCDGKLYCLNRKDGTVVWQYKAGKGAVSIYCQPLVTEEAVYFASGDGHLHGVNKKTGERLWKIRVLEDSDLYSAVATDGKKLFVTTRPEFENDNGKSALVAIGLGD